jgi:hypothetical protein
VPRASGHGGDGPQHSHGAPQEPRSTEPLLGTPFLSPITIGCPGFPSFPMPSTPTPSHDNQNKLLEATPDHVSPHTDFLWLHCFLYKVHIKIPWPGTGLIQINLRSLVLPTHLHRIPQNFVHPDPLLGSPHPTQRDPSSERPHATPADLGSAQPPHASVSILCARVSQPIHEEHCPFRGGRSSWISGVGEWTPS